MILYTTPDDELVAISYDSATLDDLKILLSQEGRVLQHITPEEFLKIPAPSGCYVNLITIDMALKKQVTQHLDNINAQRFSFIHPSADVAELNSIGPGVVIGPFVSIYRNAKITKDLVIQAQTVVGHKAVLKTGSYIGPGVIVGGTSEIGEFCYIGMSTTIVDKIKITDFVKTGAAAVIRKDITDPEVYITINNTVKLSNK
jgi:UDP-3-O-[3-hydroxymyristoyl] glucosamine N-acyltransferase